MQVPPRYIVPHLHRGCPIISLFTTQASESPAGIALLDAIGWKVAADPRRAKLPFGLVRLMSGRTPEEQATLACLRTMAILTMAISLSIPTSRTMTRVYTRRGYTPLPHPQPQPSTFRRRRPTRRTTSRRLAERITPKSSSKRQPAFTTQHLHRWQCRERARYP